LKNYEILFLIRPDLESGILKAQYKSIEDMAAKYKGKIEGVQEIGKKSLAYSIKKYKEGVYYLLNIKMDPPAVKAFREEMKLNENILRMAFTRIETKQLVKNP
jgi:small subunit ribosomal protein S6